MVDKKALLTLCVSGFMIISLSGCSKKEGDEPTKYRSQSGLERLTNEAANKATQQSTAQNNPKFSGFRDSGGKAPEVRDLDSQIRPVLRKLFGDAKIISESSSPQAKPDGEVVENRFIYSVKKILTPQDGFTLHNALRSQGFTSSPRLGSKPMEWHGSVAMSLFRTTSLRPYSLVINVDAGKQQIVVESWKLGARSDRM
jgi:hypothetical protein